jgi:uncharacterized protein DUF402
MTVPPPPDIRQDDVRAGGTLANMGTTSRPSATAAPRFEPGDPIVIREIWQGRVWYARPATVVRDDPNLTMLHVHPHAHAMEPVDAAGNALRIPTDDWAFRDTERGDAWNLSFAFPDTPYSVILGYEPDGELREYYVNLQTPLVRTDAGFDTVEHILDVQITPDRSAWAWKDEDELAEAVVDGLFTDEDVAWFRYWGERAVEHVLLREPPFDEDWSAWRPDPGWSEPVLPDDWALTLA